MCVCTYGGDITARCVLKANAPPQNGIAVFHEKRGGDKRFHKNVKFVIFIMINCYTGGESQEDDTQEEGEKGGKKMNSFLPKKNNKKF